MGFRVSPRDGSGGQFGGWGLVDKLAGGFLWGALRPAGF